MVRMQVRLDQEQSLAPCRPLGSRHPGPRNLRADLRESSLVRGALGRRLPVPCGAGTCGIALHLPASASGQRAFRASSKWELSEHHCRSHLSLPMCIPRVVSERLGHASIGITLDTYSHVLSSMQTEAMRPATSSSPPAPLPRDRSRRGSRRRLTVFIGGKLPERSDPRRATR
jgi:hypothetical protein